MTPVIRHLRANFPNLPLPAEESSLTWTFDQSVKQLGPDFYSKLVVMHPVLNMEYSILCNQLRHNFSFPEHISQDQIIAQLESALMFAELLEQLHLKYLIVPREVARLRRQQEVYRAWLIELANYSFPHQSCVVDKVTVGLSLSQQIRDYTGFTNWFRLLLTRSKRLLNLLEVVGTGSTAYSNFIAVLDKYTNPFFANIAWFFFFPRFLTNVLLLSRHTIPGEWMEEYEKALDAWTRFEAQIMRRWFELANDSVWITVGLLNCFLLVGALSPAAVYVTLFAFAFDIANTSLRAYIELNRLFKLQQDYNELYLKTDNEEDKKAIRDYQSYITHRIEFEKLRLGLSVANAVGVFIAMSLAIPFLVSNPVIPLIGAILLIAIWIASYTLTQMLEKHRPNDNVEKPANVSKLGFFARKDKDTDLQVPLDKPIPEPETPNCQAYALP